MGKWQKGHRVESGSRSSSIRAPKDSVHLVFCVAYAGTAFRGLQLQGHAPTHHTVEGVFIQALRDAGVILAVDQGRIGDANHFLGRSCRTDRGVHAVRNVISLFIPSTRFHSAFDGNTQKIADDVNAQLPLPVRVLAVTRVMPTFSSKNCCNRRVYRYYIPAYALLDPKLASSAKKLCTWQDFFEAYPSAKAALDAEQINSSQNLVPSGEAQDPNTEPSWLLDLANKVDALNTNVTSKFVGSHRFHNYTVDTEHAGKVQSKAISSLSDESVRCILRCEIAPRVYYMPTTEIGPSNVWIRDLMQEIDTASSSSDVAHPEDLLKELAFIRSKLSDTPHVPKTLPFVVFQVEGASFLLNMIRKMVGTIVATARGTRASIVEDSLSPYHRVSGPMAPGPYLALSLSTYQGYDTVAREAQRRFRERMKQQGDVPSSANDPRSTKKAPVEYLPIDEAWHSAGVDASAAAFFSNVVTRELVDADLNRAMPIDTTLFVRDFARRCNPNVAVQDASEDKHLASMKEYAPSKPCRCPPAASEMSVFLRMLQYHNWNIRPVAVPPNAKAAQEVANRALRTAGSAASCDPTTPLDGQSANGKRPREDNAPSTNDVPVDEDDSGVVDDRCPLFLDDGWIYVGCSDEDEIKLRQALIVERFKSSKKIQRELRSMASIKKQPTTDAVGGDAAEINDDEDDDAALLCQVNMGSCQDGD